MKFTEEKLETAFIELLGNENFPHHLDITIARPVDEVLIEEDLLHFLLTKYGSSHLTLTEAKSIILQLKTLPSSDLYESNKTILRWLSDGFILKREDRSQKDIHKVTVREELILVQQVVEKASQCFISPGC